MRNSARILGLMAAAALGACGGGDDEAVNAPLPTGHDASETELSAARPERALPEQFSDHTGATWTRLRRAQISDVEWTPPKTRKPRVPSSELTLEEFAEKLRPVMEIGGYEYEVDWDTALEVARQARAGLNRSAPSSGDEMPEEVSEGPETDALQGTVEGMFGSESRTKQTSGSTPWKRVGVYKNSCTISMIYNEFTAVTAAHCFKSSSSTWISRKTIRFAAGLSSQQPTIPADCYERSVPKGYDGEDGEWDFALVRLRSDIADCDESSYNVGYFGWESVDGCVSGMDATVAAYPSKNPTEGQAPPGNWTYPTMFREDRGDCETSCFGAFPSRLWHYLDSCDGMSGAPIWSVFDGDSRRIRGILTAYDPGILYESNEARRVNSDFGSYFRSYAGY